MSDAETFKLAVKSVTFSRCNGLVGITLVPEKQPEKPGDTFMFGIDIGADNAGAHALESLWNRAAQV